MPSLIVVVHDEPCLERIISGLSQRGHDVRGYSDLLAARWKSRRVEVLRPDPLPTPAEPFGAFPSWFMRDTCYRCGKDRSANLR